MSLLSEYAIIPDIFMESSYSHEEVADLHLRQLKEALLAEAVVRNLYDGDWRTKIHEQRGLYHRRGMELLKKLIQQNRLITVPKCAATFPANDVEWCDEALASCQARNLRGIITMKETARCFSDPAHQKLIGTIDKLKDTSWWSSRSNSVRLQRTTDDYLQHLDLILSCSNSLMFIDPHLDPDKRGYRDFIRLIAATIQLGKQPKIEIHRVCYEGSGPSRRIIPTTDWEEIFRRNYEAELTRLRLKMEVFIWNDFHDRYLISDLAGVLMPNGFDISHNTNELTTWGRLGRTQKDEVQREFDQSAGPQGHFVIP